MTIYIDRGHDEPELIGFDGHRCMGASEVLQNCLDWVEAFVCGMVLEFNCTHRRSILGASFFKHCIYS